MKEAILKKYSQHFLIGGLFLLTYVPTFLWLWDRWFSRDSYYSHGILIPFVTAYLIWQRRGELAATPMKTSPFGMPLIITGVVIHILSSLFRVYFTSGFSMLIVLIGLILHLYGTKIFRKTLFPVAFLLFMLPVPLVLITNISFKMKLFAAQISTICLNHLGLMAVREGSIIKMEHTYVIVDDVCSGLRSLISLMALGAIFAYWMSSKITKRIALFILTIPIAVLTNVFRIIFLASIAEIWGSQYATGFTHDFSGFMIFGLAFIMLFTTGRLLE